MALVMSSSKDVETMTRMAGYTIGFPPRSMVAVVSHLLVVCVARGVVTGGSRLLPMCLDLVWLHWPFVAVVWWLMRVSEQKLIAMTRMMVGSVVSFSC